MTAPVLVRASAGTGKTHRLTQEVVQALAPTAERRVRLEGLVAVTFTRKAHAELAARIRRALVRYGDFDHATRLPMAYVGTVHATCMRFLEESALDVGRPPYLEVLPDDGGLRLRRAIEASASPAILERLDVLARRLEICWDARTYRHDWTRRAWEIMELARANRIAPAALRDMATRSAAGLVALLGPAAPRGDELDARLDAELAASIEALQRLDDGTDKSRKVVATLTEIRARRAGGDHRWSDWVRASRVDPAVASRAAVPALKSVAAAFRRHPMLRADIEELTTSLYDTCARAMEGYASWKAQRRIVDYIDMIEGALALVERDDIARDLAERLELVVVDEFQDTSPIQLALFTRLHRFAGRSVWVGDSKQCIFEYAGADPGLIDAVAGWVADAGGATERLTRNYRSRPELVDACAATFEPLFDDARTVAARAFTAELAATAPFGIWWLDSENAAADADAIAEATAGLLRDDHLTPIIDPTTGRARPVAAHDVGILVATNKEAKDVAAGLQRRGVPANLARDGLLATPEGTLADAAMRWLLEPGDHASRAVVEALGGWNGLPPDEWLARRVAGAGDPPPPWLQPLEALRGRVALLAPSELLDELIHRLDLPTLCARWPSPRERIGNLDALRALARRYEERCARHREPATAPGLVRYFDEARRVVLIKDEERAIDDQFAGGEADGVTICTFHRAKGLEWPVVVLGSLDRGQRRDAFEPCPESDRAGFDPIDPLAGRWIRFWPWPFGQQQKVDLADDAAVAPEGRRVAHREALERQRLLYVGFTRARDHLVLAARWTRRGGKTAWLDELRTADGTPLVALPAPSAAGPTAAAVTLAGQRFPARVTVAAPTAPVPQPRITAHRFARPAPARASAAAPPPFRITPSSLTEADGPLVRYAITRVHPIGAPIALPRDTDWETFGSILHGFLAADVSASDLERRATARRLLATWRSTFDPAALLHAADALRRFVAARWPAARWQREVPITAALETPQGRRRIAGTIDLLLRLPAGVVLVDHKIYPAPSAHAVAGRAAELLPQLGAYATALARCGERVLATGLHFPAAGYWVELRAI